MLPNSTFSALITNISMKMNTSTVHYPTDSVSLGLKVVMGVSVIIGILPGVFGNLLVIAAITTTNLNHIVVNLLVLSLALTDVLISAFPLPVLTVYFIFHWPGWILGDGWCRATVYVVNLCGLVSILTMTAIAVDRYFAVQRHRSLLNRRKCTILLVVIWIFSGAVALSNILKGGTNSEKFQTGTYSVCNRISGKHISESSTRLSLIIKLLLGLPVIIGLVVIYVRMSYSVWKRRHTPTDESSRSRSVRKSRNMKIRALHMMFAIVVAFALCWIPYYIITLMRVFQITSKPDIDPGAVLFSYCLAMLNSTLNPILYALLSKRFRNAFHDILTGVSRRRIVSFRSDFRQSRTSVHKL